jgi:hypothetical protein
LTADKQKIIFWDVVKAECNGCRIDHPSQRQHQCLESIEENVEEIFSFCCIV